MPDCIKPCGLYRGAVLFKIALTLAFASSSFLNTCGACGHAAFCEELAVVAWVCGASFASVRSVGEIPESGDLEGLPHPCAWEVNTVPASENLICSLESGNQYKRVWVDSTYRSDWRGLG